MPTESLNLNNIDEISKSEKIDIETFTKLVAKHGLKLEERNTSSSRFKNCSLKGASGSIPCNGGECKIYLNYNGHAACVGCKNGTDDNNKSTEGIYACTGSTLAPGGDVIIYILADYAELSPNAQITASITLVDGEVTTVSGYLSQQVQDIISLYDSGQIEYIDVILN